MAGDLGGFVSTLRRQPHFQEAAGLTLRTLLEITDRAISGSRYAQSAKLLRGLVHLRPEGGYRGLFVLERGRAEAEAVGGRPTFLPSATSWRWVEARREPIAVDVHLGTIQSVGDPSIEEDIERPFDDESGSIHRLIVRDVTHMLVLPLVGSRTTLLGMISIEVACKAAIGEGFIWPECTPDLQLHADVAAPYLAGLPLPSSVDEEPDALLPVVGASMTPLLRIVRAFARQEEPILFLGPTGVGKSRLARWVHARSRRHEGVFEALDLASFPEETQLAELFGWRKGAFTSAAYDHEGGVARARGGTLFIDEVGNLTPNAQAGLLKLIEDRRYRPLGDDGPDREADARFVLATNTDLARAVSEGRFREDLYYRINVLPVRIPCLRERSDEIVPWSRHMLERAAQGTPEAGRVTLSAAAAVLLETYTWPGNLRQVDNVVRRAFAMACADGTAHGDVVVGEQEVHAALQLDSEVAGHGVLAGLEIAASALVAEAERHADRDELAVDLGTCDALPGVVLLAAIRRLGSVERAFEVLGRKDLVTSRNHHRTLRRAVSRIAEVYERLGRRPTEEIRRILEPAGARDPEDR